VIPEGKKKRKTFMPSFAPTSQHYFSFRTNQPSPTSQQCISLRTNQHQPSANSQTNGLLNFHSMVGIVN
jgi:hypothetical protein